MLIYTEFDGSYEFTVYRDVTPVGDAWSPCEMASTWINHRGEYVYSFTFVNNPFHFAGTPDVVLES